MVALNRFHSVIRRHVRGMRRGQTLNWELRCVLTAEKGCSARSSLPPRLTK
jgi:hypothetical protein